jgi:hypothetical protein
LPEELLLPLELPPPESPPSSLSKGSKTKGQSSSSSTSLALAAEADPVDTASVPRSAAFEATLLPAAPRAGAVVPDAQTAGVAASAPAPLLLTA